MTEQIKASIHLEMPANRNLASVLAGSFGATKTEANAAKALAYVKALHASAKRLGLPNLPASGDGLPEWLEAVTSKAKAGVGQ